jgi:dipeptidyl aminopeptidase/acylaminoacyl peptidase
MKILSTFLLMIACVAQAQLSDTVFTMKALKSYPFPNELNVSSTGSRMAWALNENGVRNIYVAEGPNFKARKLTNYTIDDGQELTSISLSNDGSWVVYVRGGDHGSNWDDHQTVNPLSSPVAPKVQILSVNFQGGDPKVLGDGEEPTISSSGVVAFHKGGQIWAVPVSGSTEAKQLFTARGSNSSAVWSPDGSKLAFQSNRGDHTFVGIYSNATTPIVWMEPSYDRDISPRWSPEGNRIAFVRTNGAGGEPDSILSRQHVPWSIMAGEVANGKIKKLWTAPKTLRGSVPTTHGSTNLNWALGRIVFLSYHDGWPHLYSIPENGGEPLLLTPGNFMCEHITMSPDKKWIVCAANAGPDAFDIDRRHIIKVPVDKQAMQVITPGAGLEWSPKILGDGSGIALISATAQRPPMLGVAPASGGKIVSIGSELLPSSFPVNELIVPKQIVFRSADGATVHAQVFERTGGSAKKPAIVYVHGGPPRQMLLGWHYSDYYANAYAMNQFLASRGFIVLSVNYRLGIGYGYEFHTPKAAGRSGASEYLDIKAAGDWLAKQANVDAKRIGVYGGSYGGFLTALALGKNSDRFAAGVDIHGVHDLSTERAHAWLNPDKFQRAPDAAQALETAWKSSPSFFANTWKSPVLMIHGDDDRNVRFSQSTDLVLRLRKFNVPMETLVIPDDTHHFMLHRNQVKVNKATADFLERKLK